MKTKLLLCASFLLTTVLANASPVLIAGTPSDSLLASPTGPSPTLSTLINFDSLTNYFSTFAPGTYASQGVTSISSPDGLLVLPFSTQSSPNELYDNSSDGSANVTINLASGTSAIGIGIADSDPVSITLQALGFGGVDLGSAFNVIIPETTANPGNGYYVLENTSADIYGLQITQLNGSAGNYSGLAVDDLQYETPEPGSIVLFTSGLAFLGGFRLRKRA